MRVQMAPAYEPTSIFKTAPADAHQGCQLEDAEASVCRRFLGSSSDKPALVCVCVNNGRAGGKEQ